MSELLGLVLVFAVVAVLGLWNERSTRRRAVAAERRRVAARLRRRMLAEDDA